MLRNLMALFRHHAVWGGMGLGITLGIFVSWWVGILVFLGVQIVAGLIIGVYRRWELNSN